MAEKRKNLPTSFIMPPDLKKIAKRAAADDQRSLSSLMVLALEEYLGKRGYLTIGYTEAQDTKRTASTPEARKTWSDLAKDWLMFASDLEANERLLWGRPKTRHSDQNEKPTTQKRYSSH